MLNSFIRRLAAGYLTAGALLLAQTPTVLPAPFSKQVDANEVVATVEGEKLTPARIQVLRDSLPQQFQQAVSKMDNRTFLKSYGELVTLARLAEKGKVADQEPYKGQFEFMRMNFLAQSYLDYLGKTLPVSQEDFVSYYNQHKADFEEADVRAIYVAFVPAGSKPASSEKAKKPLTEQEAKAKADSLVAQLKTGADFITAARENSDDAATAQKGGDLGTLKKSAQGIPEELRNVIFNLKPGEVSAPARQQAGFYIFKVEKARTIPFEEAAVNLAPTVRSIKVKAELDRIMKDIKITYDNEGYFNGTAGVVSPSKPAAPVAPPPAAPAPKPSAAPAKP